VAVISHDIGNSSAKTAATQHSDAMMILHE
jgi:hypothetical protein